MCYMEIALLPKGSLRIKGKQAAIGVDSQDKGPYNAILAVAKNPQDITVDEGSLLVIGPGEYEVGGIKLSGVRSETELAFTVKVDGVDVLVGRINSLDKMQHKLKEHNIVVAFCDSEANASFLTSLASNVIMFCGDHAKEAAQALSKDNLKSMPKYAATLDKLPQEVETIILE